MRTLFAHENVCLKTGVLCPYMVIMTIHSSAASHHWCHNITITAEKWRKSALVLLIQYIYWITSLCLRIYIILDQWLPQYLDPCAECVLWLRLAGRWQSRIYRITYLSQTALHFIMNKEDRVKNKPMSKHSWNLIRVVVTNRKKFVCVFCDWGFDSQQDLQVALSAINLSNTALNARCFDKSEVA